MEITRSPAAGHDGTEGHPTFIDLFAGCGGLSLGLHQAGWQGLFAIERDPMAFETYYRNFLDQEGPYAGDIHWPSWLEQRPYDINELLDSVPLRQKLTDLRGKVTLVAGGPPCQGFSVGGARNGADVRNDLVHRMLDFIEVVRPSMVVIENVEGMARPFRSKPNGKAESVATEAVAALEALGYRAAIHHVDASRYGVPQTRRRLLIFATSVGVSDSPNLLDAMDFVRKTVLRTVGLPVDRAVTVREAIDDLNGPDSIACPDSPKFSAGTYSEAVSPYAQYMRARHHSSAPPNSHRFSVHGERIQAMYEAAHASQRRGRLRREFMLAFGTKKDKKVLLEPDMPSSTITTHPDEFIHYAIPRNVTVREMARLQSFPDDFYFYGRYTINGPRRRYDVARCSQVGNAVPPLLARVLGAALTTMLRGQAPVSTQSSVGLPTFPEVA
jgi:DNA (cytosine-5)-methyltransferase 1